MKKILFAAVFVLFLIGCSDSPENHPLLRKAAQSIRMGEFRNAELCYKKYLEKNPNAAQVHLDLAELYDEHLEDYLLAVYHYKEFLRLTDDEDSKNVKSVKEFIERCERRYVGKTKTVKTVLLTDEAEIERMTAAYKKRLADEEARLARELAELKKEAGTETSATVSEKTETDSSIAPDVKKAPAVSETAEADSPIEDSVKTETSEKLTADSDVSDGIVSAAVKTPDTAKTSDTAAAPGPEKNETVKTGGEVIKDFSKLPEMETVSTTPVVAAPAASADTPVSPASKPEIREYKVQKGDTFTHLSRKFYGSIRYYRKLMEYNKISNPNALRIGKTIMIPPLEILKGEK